MCEKVSPAQDRIDRLIEDERRIPKHAAGPLAGETLDQLLGCWEV